MNRAHDIGTRIGAFLGRLLDPIVGAKMRAHYAERFGVCRSCAAPLSGPSPDRICDTCHAGEVLRSAFGDDGVAAIDMIRERASGGDA